MKKRLFNFLDVLTIYLLSQRRVPTIVLGHKWWKWDGDTWDQAKRVADYWNSCGRH